MTAVRRLLVLLLVLAATQHVAAAYEPAPSGRYYDPATRTVYWYDNYAHLLVPLALDASPEGYFEIDVYRQGERPTPATGETAFCRSTYCVTWTAAVANPGQVERSLKVNITYPCLPEAWGPHYSVPKENLAFPVPPQTVQVPCAGPVNASLVLDGVEVDRDGLQ